MDLIFTLEGALPLDDDVEIRVRGVQKQFATAIKNVDDMLEQMCSAYVNLYGTSTLDAYLMKLVNRYLPLDAAEEEA